MALLIGGERLVMPVDAADMSSTIASGTVWQDDRGAHINAHGGGILVHEGTYYWFGEHKTSGQQGNTATHGVHVYSSTNLLEWVDEGIALAVSEDSESPIASGCVLERPKVIYNEQTGTFVMWFHLELRGRGYDAAMTGLAVADEVTGPYTFVNALRPNAGNWPQNFEKDSEGSELVRRDFEGGQMSRDMTLYVDDDGTAYHIHASEENQTLHISELTDDFQEFTGRYVRALPGKYNEAPAICKYEGTYYLLTSGCTGWAPNEARLAKAPNILGPWTELRNPCVGVNSATGLGPEKTFGGQSTFILPVPGQAGAFVAMFDEWRPRNAMDGRYYWLPIEIKDGTMRIEWLDELDPRMLFEGRNDAPAK